MAIERDNIAFASMISTAFVFRSREKMNFFRLKSLTIIDGEHVERRDIMKDFIETPTISEILREEFMEPMNLSAYRLAQEIHVPVSRIQAILNSGRRITPDTSLRLAKYFGVSDRYFLDLQSDIDLRNLKASMKNEIAEIKPYAEAI
jgi:antitoxin HigA-1